MVRKYILVTGAGGFIGSNLVEKLLLDGYKVRVLLNNRESTKNIKEHIKNPDIQLIRGNLINKSVAKLACRDVETVFHLAAKTDLFTKKYKPYFLNNVIATKNLFFACNKNIKNFIYFSSILAVGLPNTRIAITESYQGKAESLYGISKKEAETFLLNMHKRFNFPVTILRPTTVYGPKEIAVQYKLFQVIKDHKFFMIGKGNNLVSYLYVKNLTDLCVRLINKRNVFGVYFINDRKPYKFFDVIKTIYKTIGINTMPLQIPFYIAYTCSFLYSRACQFVGIKPLIYPSRVKTMVLNYAYSIKKAEKSLGYKPRYDLSQGIKETYEWYKRNQYL